MLVVTRKLNQKLVFPGTRTTVHFAPTQALPTYLFGFAAGKFIVERGERNGRPFRLYHRETDAAKVARNRDALFDLRCDPPVPAGLPHHPRLSRDP